MNELTGKLVNVVLAVEDGKGMEYLRYPITIVANFNGRILESDPANPEECPIFNTELVWEIEKKDLRKIRSSNVPLRVECFTSDTNGRKVKVGFVLLSLRSAYIVPKRDAQQEVPFKWQRLNGVSHDIRSRHPELYLSLSIRECLPEDAAAGARKEVASPFLAEEVLELTEDLGMTIPLKYLEDGFIHVGHDKEVAPYHLSIVVKTAANLDVLLPENLVFNGTKDKYHLAFTLFGITIKSKILKDLHDSITLKEKIVVSLLSRLETLQAFFTEYRSISVCLHNGPDKLGVTEINVERLLETETMSEEEICYFHLPGGDAEIPESMNGRKPFIEVRTSLQQRNDSNEIPPISAGEARRTKTITSSLERIPVDAAGDAKTSTDSVLRSYLSSPRQIYVPMLELEDDGEVDYQNFCLRLVMENISWRKPPKLKQFQIQFCHPRADTCVCFTRDTQCDLEQILEGVDCVVYFISTKKKVRGLLFAWRPKILFLNSRGGAISDTVKIESDVFALKEIQEHTQILTLKSAETKEILAEITVVMHLEELDEIPAPKQNDLLPPLLDERIVVLELKQLKKFKEDIMDLYEREFETRSKQRLGTLEDEWRRNKEAVEEKLNRNVRKCKMLTKQLKSAARNLRMRQKKTIEVEGCSEASLRAEISNNYTKFASYQYMQLIEEISRIQLENKQLKELIGTLEEELEANKKSALTKEQTTNLLKELRILEEQFEEAQKQKSYFKEQWKKAVKEIHDLRTEEQKQLLNVLEQNKHELSQLSLECESSYFEVGEGTSDVSEDGK